MCSPVPAWGVAVSSCLSLLLPLWQPSFQAELDLPFPWGPSWDPLLQPRFSPGPGSDARLRP